MNTTPTIYLDDQLSEPIHWGRNPHIVFDIETGPLQSSILDDRLKPFREPVPVFDESQVKYGNLKDPAKRAQKLIAAREQHAQAIAKWEYAQVQHAEHQREDAALHAWTGRVIAIGYADDEQTVIHGCQTDCERCVLDIFWRTFEAIHTSGGHIIGHYITRFDLPFLMQRSIILDVDYPRGLLMWKDRHWQETIIDTFLVWQCGLPNVRVSLNDLCRYLDILLTKPADGARAFAHQWENDRESAIQYLANDLNMTYRIACRLGLIRVSRPLTA